MGWKTSIIIASQDEQPNLAYDIRHDADAAARIAAALPGDFAFAGESTFEEGAYPRNGNLYVGAYGNSLLIGHMDLAGSCFNGDVPPVVSAVDAVLPRSSILALELHSVVNLYGYALFEKNRLVRGRAGSADDGVFLDVGEPLSEEQPLLDKSVVNADGEQVWVDEFDGVTEEMDHSCMGEEFVFEVSRRFFGERFDCFDHDKLLMSEFKSTSKTFWQRLFGRK
ncbi:hypothetical protein NHH03_00475 [Stieleria sp. TO1_6]|uniref:DUF6928 family protein n=1 Tax=Stieleria tagensis TaxID=2956795 RepID=UPI00209AE39A|nr:hypothetical protein [Stieleria tagensis]MCO8120195.1 hypothetical protein [Stieleria tagensis]